MPLIKPQCEAASLWGLGNHHRRRKGSYIFWVLSHHLPRDCYILEGTLNHHHLGEDSSRNKKPIGINAFPGCIVGIPHLTIHPTEFMALLLLFPMEKKGDYMSIHFDLFQENPPSQSASFSICYKHRPRMFKIHFCSVLFFLSRWKAPLYLYLSIIPLALIALLWSPAYFKSIKSVLAIHCLWHSFFSPLILSNLSFFGKNIGFCQNSDLSPNLFPDDIWPKNSAFWLSCCC